MNESRIELIPLFKDLVVQTEGTALTKTTLDLDIPRFRNILPHCEALFLIGLTDGVASTGVIEWNVTLFSGWDRNHELTNGVELSRSGGTPVNFTAPGPSRSLDFVDAARFLLEGRLQLYWQNAAGVGVPKSGRLSCVLGARRYSR